MSELLPLISLELKRARRYERPLSILALDHGVELPRPRATDVVAVSPRHERLLVVLPEAGRASAIDYGKRLLHETGFAPVAAISFPEDALSLDLLLSLLLEA